VSDSGAVLRDCGAVMRLDRLAFVVQLNDLRDIGQAPIGGHNTLARCLCILACLVLAEKISAVYEH
jgi:hypothetical protein